MGNSHTNSCPQVLSEKTCCAVTAMRLNNQPPLTVQGPTVVKQQLRASPALIVPQGGHLQHTGNRHPVYPQQGISPLDKTLWADKECFCCGFLATFLVCVSACLVYACWCTCAYICMYNEWAVALTACFFPPRNGGRVLAPHELNTHMTSHNEWPWKMHGLVAVLSKWMHNWCPVTLNESCEPDLASTHTPLKLGLCHTADHTVHLGHCAHPYIFTS